jgi:aquaporin Z
MVGKRFPAKEALQYIVAQVVGAITAASALAYIEKGKEGFTTLGNFAANGYAEHSPGHYSMLACFLAEFLLTAFFLIVIMGSTDARVPKGFAPISVGLCLTLIHLIGIPITNTSVNPARSTSQAIFAGGWALGQLWLFWAAPLMGGLFGGYLYRGLFEEKIT